MLSCLVCSYIDPLKPKQTMLLSVLSCLVSLSVNAPFSLGTPLHTYTETPEKMTRSPRSMGHRHRRCQQTKLRHQGGAAATDPRDTSRDGRAPSVPPGGGGGEDVLTTGAAAARAVAAEAVVVGGDVRETTPVDKRVEEEAVAAVEVFEGVGAEQEVEVGGGAGARERGGGGAMGATEGVRLVPGMVLGLVLGLVLRRRARGRTARGGRTCTGPGRRSGR